MIDAALVSYVGVMSVTPGPNNLLLAASGVHFGLRRTLPHALGVSSGHFLQVLGMTLAFGVVSGFFRDLRPYLALVGVCYLLWLSWRIARAGVPEETQARKPMKYWEAILFQGINPKAWVMVINTALLFAPRSGEPLGGALGLAALCALVNLPCVSVWAVMGDRLRRFLAQGRAALIFNGVMGTLMALTALWLLVEEGARFFAAAPKI